MVGMSVDLRALMTADLKVGMMENKLGNELVMLDLLWAD